MEMPKAVSAAPIDTGLESLALLLHFHGVAADVAQIRHRFASARVGMTEMLRCAREFKLKARALTSDWRRLGKLPLPAWAAPRGGVLGRS